MRESAHCKTLEVEGLGLVTELVNTQLGDITIVVRVVVGLELLPCEGRVDAPVPNMVRCKLR